MVSTTPWHSASSITCQTRTTPPRVKAASIEAITRLAVWVKMTSWRRETRSASTPARGAPTSDGPKRETLSRPRANGESVRRKTSHDWAMTCIQVPLTETPCPIQNSRNDR